MVLGFGGQGEPNLRFFFLQLLVLLARNSEFTKSKSTRESFLVACDCSLVQAVLLHTPQGARLNFAGCGCLWGTVAIRT